MPMTGGAGARAELASCDGARLFWFAAALAGSEAPGAPDAALLREIRSEREAIRQCEGGGACAVAVAYAIENCFGWPAFEGVHLEGVSDRSKIVAAFAQCTHGACEIFRTEGKGERRSHEPTPPFCRNRPNVPSAFAGP